MNQRTIVRSSAVQTQTVVEPAVGRALQLKQQPVNSTQFFGHVLSLYILVFGVRSQSKVRRLVGSKVGSNDGLSVWCGGDVALDFLIFLCFLTL